MFFHRLTPLALLLSVVKIKVKKRNNMENGIGPQNLGAAGMSTKSKPCGTPLDFNEKLRAEVGKGTLNPGFEKAIKENDPATNYGTPLDFQDDVAAIQAAASKLESHNVGSGGEVQGAAAAAQENVASSQLAQLAAGQDLAKTMGGPAVGGPAGRILRNNTNNRRRYPGQSM
jgi:hypothetical protein